MLILKIFLERLEKITDLLSSDDSYTKLRAALILTGWGNDDGFNVLTNMLISEKIKDYFSHRLYGFDESLKHVLNALIGYWSSKSDRGQEEEARQAIFPYLSQIIKQSETDDFSIVDMFWLIKDKHFTEYLPLIEEHLIHISNFPDTQYWKIHDDLELLLEVNPSFVSKLLDEKGKTLEEFGIKD